jgi:hypothetical protein
MATIRAGWTVVTARSTRYGRAPPGIQEASRHKHNPEQRPGPSRPRSRPTCQFPRQPAEQARLNQPDRESEPEHPGSLSKPRPSRWEAAPCVRALEQSLTSVPSAADRSSLNRIRLGRGRLPGTHRGRVGRACGPTFGKSRVRVPRRLTSPYPSPRGGVHVVWCGKCRAGEVLFVLRRTTDGAGRRGPKDRLCSVL